jgi:hypothetical protein
MCRLLAFFSIFGVTLPCVVQLLNSRTTKWRKINAKDLTSCTEIMVMSMLEWDDQVRIVARMSSLLCPVRSIRQQSFLPADIRVLVKKFNFICCVHIDIYSCLLNKTV